MDVSVLHMTGTVIFRKTDCLFLLVTSREDESKVFIATWTSAVVTSGLITELTRQIPADLYVYNVL